MSNLSLSEALDFGEFLRRNWECFSCDETTWMLADRKRFPAEREAIRRLIALLVITIASGALAVLINQNSFSNRRYCSEHSRALWRRAQWSSSRIVHGCWFELRVNLAVKMNKADRLSCRKNCFACAWEFDGIKLMKINWSWFSLDGESSSSRR